MLRRKIMNDLQDWKDNRSAKKALFIMGARQVGKSTIARWFGKHNYRKVIEINFFNDPGAARIFKAGSAQNILIQLTAYTGQRIEKGQTLIILDAIQECPEARTAIKFLVEDGTCDYIETGSLLGIEYKPVASYPVGFEQQISMYPMDFEEFLWALNYPEESIEYLRDCYETHTPVGDAAHKMLMSLFQTYIVVGGMPEVVQTYVKTKDISEVIERQKTILSLYRNDISKYSTGLMSLKIKQIFDAIPSQLDEKNRRFIMSALGKGKQLRELENAFLWLEEAGVALPCYNTSAPVAPLALNAKRNLFKLFLNDTGLLCAQCFDDLQIALLQGDLSVNSGSILENVFAQALKAKGFKLYYYDSKRIGELDFVVQNGSKIDVLEIKSGRDYHKHSALTKALGIQEWSFDQKIVFCPGNIDKENGVLYMPLYMIMFYLQHQSKHIVWDPFSRMTDNT